MSSPSAASGDVTESDENGTPPPTVKHADGQDIAFGEVGPGAGQQHDVENGPNEQQGPNARVESRDNKGRRLQKERRLIAQRQRAYLNLLERNVAEDDGSSPYGHPAIAPLSASLIGGSLWTVDEKERLFSALARHGVDDIPKVSRRVNSKSDLEVRLYILDLRAGLEYGLSKEPARKYVSRADVPAALEVGEQCEWALDLAADVALTEQRKPEAEAERKRLGDAWLIDSGAAALIDAQLDGTLDDKDVNPDSNGQVAQQTRLLTPATRFFDVSMLLQLSHNLFMNGPPEGYWNYRTSELVELAESEKPSSGSSESDEVSPYSPPEPAIYPSALSELHDLAKTVTQRLVHATLFQATSRLRGKEYSSPAPVVLASDVHTAVDVLGLDFDWKTYWAKLPRRAGLGVYSDSDKYRRGRIGTKNGVKLTCDEVESELGLPAPRQPSKAKPQDLPVRLNAENSNSADLASDADTPASDSDVSSDGIIEVKLEHAYRKRRRGLSPNSFEREEERYMTALDREADWEENARLREMLGLEKLEAVEEEIPERPKLKKRFRGQMLEGWREEAEYAPAAWEVEYQRRLREEQSNSDDEEMDSESGSASSDPRREEVGAGEQQRAESGSEDG